MNTGQAPLLGRKDRISARAKERVVDDLGTGLISSQRGSAVYGRPVFGASCHTCLPARVAAGHNSPFTCPACRLRSWALTPLHRVPPHQYRTCRWAVDASPVRTESTGPTLITAPTPPKHFNRSVTAASSRSRPRHRQVPGPLAVMSSRWRRRRGEDFAVSSTALSGIEATTVSGPRCCTKPWG